MVLFAADLDNTLVYSRRRLTELAAEKNFSFPDDFICVECIDGQGCGYMSRRTVRMLAELRAKMGFVPITTRSLAQYRRMAFPAEIMPHFALVANGALLLCDGATDATWQNKTKAVAALARNELLRLAEKLAADYAFRGKPPQLIDDIFLFVRVANDADFDAALLRVRNATRLCVGTSGRKIYIFPDNMDKGTALDRLKKLTAASFVFAAGDSPLDLPMLQKSDCAFVPNVNIGNELLSVDKIICDGKGLFSEQILEHISRRFDAG